MNDLLKTPKQEREDSARAQYEQMRNVGIDPEYTRRLNESRTAYKPPMSDMERLIETLQARRAQWAKWANEEPIGSKHGEMLGGKIVILDMVILDAKNHITP